MLWRWDCCRCIPIWRCTVCVHVSPRIVFWLWRRLMLTAPVLASGTESSPTVTPTTAVMASRSIVMVHFNASYCGSACMEERGIRFFLLFSWQSLQQNQNISLHRAESPLFYSTVCSQPPHTLIPCIMGHSVFLSEVPWLPASRGEYMWCNLAQGHQQAL